MIANRTGKDDDITSLGLCSANDMSFSYSANPGSRDVQSICFALLDNFCIACDNLHSCFLGGDCHRSDHALQRFHGQAFFEDEPCR